MSERLKVKRSLPADSARPYLSQRITPADFPNPTTAVKYYPNDQRWFDTPGSRFQLSAVPNYVKVEVKFDQDANDWLEIEPDVLLECKYQRYKLRLTYIGSTLSATTTFLADRDIRIFAGEFKKIGRDTFYQSHGRVDQTAIGGTGSYVNVCLLNTLGKQASIFVVSTGITAWVVYSSIDGITYTETTFNTIANEVYKLFFSQHYDYILVQADPVSAEDFQASAIIRGGE